MNYLHVCSEVVGKHEADVFHENTFWEMHELLIDSPIEQLLYAAMRMVQRLNSIRDNDPIQLGNEHFCWGLDITPQYEIKPYRVDFFVSFYPMPKKDQATGLLTALCRSVIVECDSQEWHERTERERRYEKLRDRTLVKAGHKIFRFTGAEIMKDPVKIACEVLAFVQDESAEALYEYTTELNSDLS